MSPEGSKGVDHAVLCLCTRQSDRFCYRAFRMRNRTTSVAERGGVLAFVMPCLQRGSGRIGNEIEDE